MRCFLAADWLAVYQFIGTFVCILFGMAWFPCCCQTTPCETDCPRCTDNPLPRELFIDLGSGGLTTVVDSGCCEPSPCVCCPPCPDLQGLWSVICGRNAEFGDSCEWGENYSSWCIYPPGGSCTGSGWHLHLLARILDDTTGAGSGMVRWRIYIRLTSNNNFFNTSFAGQTWESLDFDPGDCSILPRTLTQTGAWGGGAGCPQCNGSLPSTISITS